MSMFDDGICKNSACVSVAARPPPQGFRRITGPATIAKPSSWVKLDATVPTALREDGFEVRIHLPPREHWPPHVHVRKGDASIVIALPYGDAGLSIRTVSGMRAADVVRAYRLVETYVDLLLTIWRTHHGEAPDL